MGTNLLAKLGIPTGELESKGDALQAWHYPGTTGYRNKVTGKQTNEPMSMGIEFRRMIGGIPCDGQKVHFRFEDEERLASLEVRWHGLQTVKELPVATKKEIIEWIKQGHARAQAVETTGSRWIKVRDIKKIIIRDVELSYDTDRDGGEKLSLYPFAVITAEIEFSPKDSETLVLLCPVVEEGLTRAIRKVEEFNIYPSKRLEKERQEAEAIEAAKGHPNL